MPSSLVKIKYFLRETGSALLTGLSPPSGSLGSRGRSTSAQDSQEWRVGASNGEAAGTRRQQQQQQQEGICMTEMR